MLLSIFYMNIFRIMKYIDKEIQTVYFGGGCFWCLEPPIDALEGVISTTVGYTGGHDTSPTYEKVISGSTGHYEAIKVVFDPTIVKYDQLLDVFWRQIDPTDQFGQFADQGPQYRTAIFTNSTEQQKLAEASKQELETSKKFPAPIVTKILPASTFYEAEDYHQNYYKKAPLHYQRYKKGSGREGFLKRHWP